MVQCELFLLALKTMTTKYPDHLPALSTPTITNKILATTFQDHQHPPCTGKWDLASSQKLDIGSLSLSLQFIKISTSDTFTKINQFHSLPRKKPTLKLSWQYWTSKDKFTFNFFSFHSMITVFILNTLRSINPLVTSYTHL